MQKLMIGLGVLLCGQFDQGCTADNNVIKPLTELAASCSSGPCQGSPGPQGPQGPQGNPGIPGIQGPPGPLTLDALSNYEIDPNPLFVALPDELPFNNNPPNTPMPVVQGSSISQMNEDVFVFTQSGDYYVSFVGNLSGISPGAPVQFFVNNEAVGRAVPVQIGGTQILLDGIISITASPTNPSVLTVIAEQYDEQSVIIFDPTTPTMISIIALNSH